MAEPDDLLRHTGMTEAMDFIRNHLVREPVPSIPEISLRKAGPKTGLSHLYDNLYDDGPAPYWAFSWGGGLGLARYVLDHPDVVAGKAVLDLGTGSGLVAIAAAMAGAKSVLASDIDPYAIASVRVNSDENQVTINTMIGNLLASDPPDVDVVLVGDLFYEAALADRVTDFLARCRARRIQVLVGDPGRRFLPRDRLTVLADYPGHDFGLSDRPDACNQVFAFR